MPEHFLNRYTPESLPLPIESAPEEWPRHPVLELQRHQGALEEPFDERTFRNALAAYYGLVTFLDEQIGQVLQALDEAGLRETTRIIYTSDHGEMLGTHGLWWKSAMYEGAAGVPLILAGPDIPPGKVVTANVSLVDCYPSLVEALGAHLTPEDNDLPGLSLWQLAQGPDRPRTVFSEYHAIYSPSGVFMIRNERYKYIYYVGYPPQLFDLQADPDERRDLAGDPRHAEAHAACARELRSIVDPEEVDRRARADQHRRMEAAGGAAAILAQGIQVPYSPAPEQFEPAPVAAREHDAAHRG